MNADIWEGLLVILFVWTSGAAVGSVITNAINERRFAEREEQRKADSTRRAGMVREAKAGIEGRAQAGA